MTPDRKLLEAALEGFALQRKAIEAREAEIREALKSPIEVMREQLPDGIWRKKIASLLDDGSTMITDVTAFGKRPKRKMSAAGRAAISRATKARWAKYRKEKNRGA